MKRSSATMIEKRPTYWPSFQVGGRCMYTLHHYRLTLARIRREFEHGTTMEEALAIARSLFDRQVLADRPVGEERSSQTTDESSIATLSTLR